MIEDGSRVKFHLRMMVGGQEVAMSRGGEPFEYVHGRGGVLQGIEENLGGMNPGEYKTFNVPPEKAYGHRDPTAITTVSRGVFSEPDKVSEGQTVKGKIEGEEVRAVVTRVADDEVTIDLNHPLAGKTLQLEVEVVDVS
jgi:FKBP-type peptidyl-prolyl cis-trans isomerase 2